MRKLKLKIQYLGPDRQKTARRIRARTRWSVPQMFRWFFDTAAAILREISMGNEIVVLDQASVVHFGESLPATEVALKLGIKAPSDPGLQAVVLFVRVSKNHSPTVRSFKIPNGRIKPFKIEIASPEQ